MGRHPDIGEVCPTKDRRFAVSHYAESRRFELHQYAADPRADHRLAP
jgi:hypothetical protein